MARRGPAIVEDEDDDAGEAPDERELEAGRMPFLQHLAELRDRVRNAAIGFVVAFVVCWGFAGHIYTWLREPMFHVWNAHQLGTPQVVFTSLTEPFWVDMSIGMWAGIFVSSPFIFYQLWQFIAPGLYKRERRYAILFAFFSALLFVAGALFCYYFMLENLYGFLLSFGSSELRPMISQRDYLDFTRNLMLATGAVFELPLLIYFLALVGMVTHRGLLKFGRWFIVIAFVGAALIAPGPCVTQIMIAIPMIALYYISIVFAWRVTKKRELRDAALSASAAADDARRRERRRRKLELVEDEDEDGSED